MRHLLINLTALSGLLFLFCISEYNPFDDPANIRVAVDSISFGNGDTVSIFSTQTMTFTPLLKEKIDSFKIQAEDNRLWSNGETTIVNISKLSELDTFRISIFDTGSKNIEITTFYDKNKTHVQKLFLYAYSKLSQTAITGSFGDSIPLSANTNGITDTDIRFQWDFGHNTIITSYQPTIKTVIVAADNGSKGKLTVSDKSGLFRSPEAEFIFSFEDTTNPSITCISEAYQGLDTIYTGDSIFTLKVKVVDRGDVFVDSVLINGTLFTYNNIHGKYHYEIFPEIYKHQPPDTPITAIITAYDEMEPPNSSCDTFFLYFKEGEDTTNSTVITINNIQDGSTVQDSNFIIFGSVENRKDSTLIMKASINGKMLPISDTVPGGKGDWVFPLALSVDSNNVCVRAYNSNGDSLASKWVIFFYDRTINDDIKPEIWKIKVNDNVILNEHRPLFIKKTSAIINVTAFDKESRLKEVLIANQRADKVSETEWHRRVAIPHSLDAKTSIIVTDINNNSREITIKVIQNTLPYLTDSISNFILDVDYTKTLKIPTSNYDADLDQVKVIFTYLQSWWKQQGNSITGKPPAIGSDSILFILHDGFQSTDTMTWKYSIVDRVKFTSSLSDQLPRWLIAQRDSLNTILSTESGASPFVYNALLLPDNKTLLNNSTGSALLWIPTESDTGKKTLQLTVSDLSQTGDTLFHTLSVLPANSYHCSLSVRVDPDSVFYSDTIDLSDTVSAKLTFTIHDNDPGIHEKYLVTITRLNGTKTFETDSFQFTETVKPLLYNKVAIEQFDISVVDTSDKVKNPYMTLYIKHPWSGINDDGLIMWHDAQIGVFVKAGTERVEKWRDVNNKQEYLLNLNPNLDVHPLLKIDSDIVNIQFQGGNRFNYVEKLDAGNWADSSFTVFFVAELIDNISIENQYTLLSSMNEDDSYNLGVLNVVPGVFKREGVTSNHAYSTKFTPIETNKYYIYNFIYNSLTDKDMYVRLNGIQDTIDIAAYNCKVKSLLHCMVGANRKPLNEGWKGGIAELIVYKKFLTEAEIKKIETYLSKKYTISLYDRNLLKEEYRY